MSAEYNPAAPMAERLNALRSLVKRDTCTHDWVCVQGATLCCRCGADLEGLLAEFRNASDPYAGGTRKAVTVDADQRIDEEPHTPGLGDSVRTAPGWWYCAVAVVFAVVGWLVVR